MVISVAYEPGWTGGFNWLVYLGFAFSFVLAFGGGANDTANSFGVVVGSGVLKLWQAYILAAVFDTIGGALLGYTVTEAIQKMIVDVDVYTVYARNYSSNGVESWNASLAQCPISNTSHDTAYSNNGTMYGGGCMPYTSAEFMAGEIGAMVGSAFWQVLATIFSMPVSTTQSTVGGTIGFSLVLKGSAGIHWNVIYRTAASWLISPIMAGAVSSCFYLIIKTTVLAKEDPYESSLFMLPIFFAFTVMVIVFAIVFDGSKYLMLDTLTWWQAGLTSIGVAFVVGLLVKFIFIKYIRNATQHYRDIRATTMQPLSIISGTEVKLGFWLMVDASWTLLASLPFLVVFKDRREAAKKPEASMKRQPYVEIFLCTDDNTMNLNTVNQANESNEIKAEGHGNVVLNNTHAPVTGDHHIDVEHFSGYPPHKTDHLVIHPHAPLAHKGESVGAQLVRLRNDSVVAAEGTARPWKLLEKVQEDARTVLVFHYLQILSACYLSFSHGTNDTANSVGPLVGLWVTWVYGYAGTDVSGDYRLLLLLLFGTLSGVVGVVCLAHRVIKTLGKDVTTVSAPSGLCMELGSAFTILVGSKLRIPLSTTHCMVGSVTCVGWLRNREPLKWKLLGKIAFSWLVTLPVAGGVSALVAWTLVYALFGSNPI